MIAAALSTSFSHAQISQPVSQAQVVILTGQFKITALWVSATNAQMHFRVTGMPTVFLCISAPKFAYVDASDIGAQDMIATLISAFNTGKQVNLLVQPTDFLANGSSFCHIIEVTVSG
jgi:uncharacterized membrane protein